MEPKIKIKMESESCSVMSDSFRPRGPHSPRNSPGQNTGVGSLSLLQGIFPTQGSNPGLLHCRQTLYQLRRKIFSTKYRPRYPEILCSGLRIKLLKSSSFTSSLEHSGHRAYLRRIHHKPNVLRRTGYKLPHSVFTIALPGRNFYRQFPWDILPQFGEDLPTGD